MLLCSQIYAYTKDLVCTRLFISVFLILDFGHLDLEVSRHSETTALVANDL
jgi:hypothetical protein